LAPQPHPFSLFGPAFATRLITEMYFTRHSVAGVRPDLQRNAEPGGAIGAEGGNQTVFLDF
jgi:protocatechuate 3,4-dioxygenase beta subunit